MNADFQEGTSHMYYANCIGLDGIQVVPGLIPRVDIFAKVFFISDGRAHSEINYFHYFLCIAGITASLANDNATTSYNWSNIPESGRINIWCCHTSD